MNDRLTGSRGTTSIGEGASPRLVALNAFTREPAEIAVKLHWARTPATAEVWRCTRTELRRLGEELRQFLDGDVWDDLAGGTEPVADFDRDELALPPTIRHMLLVQYEPRRPEEATPGEVHRVCVYYEPAALAWKVIQWSVPVAGSELMELRFVEEGGRLALADEGEPAAYLVDVGDGRLALDDLAEDGLRIIASNTRILPYQR